ncbi:MAG: glycoside hydrolase family 19 protein [Burkholderiales bacterium]|nr:glycoside hydrolase family 19 protein [Burkholderiales bacterium]
MDVDLLREVSGCSAGSARRFAGPISAAMEEFGIDSALRQAHFIAQIAHESARFTRLEENLNYSWQRLMEIWPKRFPNESFARQFHRQPQRIANWVYAERMGNGPPSTGDGWRYRGRGLLQITGKRNYARCSAALGMDLISDPDLLLLDGPAARSAAWHWSDIGANRMADENDVVAITKAINGGLIGIDDRRLAAVRAMNALLA